MTLRYNFSPRACLWFLNYLWLLLYFSNVQILWFIVHFQLLFFIILKNLLSVNFCQKFIYQRLYFLGQLSNAFLKVFGVAYYLLRQYFWIFSNVFILSKPFQALYFFQKLSKRPLVNSFCIFQ